MYFGEIDPLMEKLLEERYIKIRQIEEENKNLREEIKQLRNQVEELKKNESK